MFKEHFHPSTHNPNWCPEMEARFRAQLTEQGYIHEILAEFGTEEAGVFNKDKLDEAMLWKNYAYNPLDYFQEEKCKHEGSYPIMYDYNVDNVPPYTPFRCMGVDWVQALFLFEKMRRLHVNCYGKPKTQYTTKWFEKTSLNVRKLEKNIEMA